MRPACIGTLGNTKILMIYCVNINFRVTFHGSNFTSGLKFDRKYSFLYSARNFFDPRHKCSNGLSACVAGIVTTVKQNKENKYGNFRRNLYIFL